MSSASRSTSHNLAEQCSGQRWCWSEKWKLISVSHLTNTSSRRGNNFILESIDGKLHLTLPPLIECDIMSDDRAEIPSPEIAHYHPHLKPVADKIEPVDEYATILLLIERHNVRVHKVLSRSMDPTMDLMHSGLTWDGWWWGKSSLGQAHKSSEVNVYKTNM